MNEHGIMLVAVVSLVTVVLRFLPFWLFGGRRKTPELVTYLGQVLPYSIMGMLVVYCLRGISFQEKPHGLPELICVVLVVLLHWKKRNTLLSIAGGTACYMVLIQTILK